MARGKRPARAYEEGGEAPDQGATRFETRKYQCQVDDGVLLPDGALFNMDYSDQAVAARVYAGASLMLGWESQELLIRTSNNTNIGK